MGWRNDGRKENSLRKSMFQKYEKIDDSRERNERNK